MKDLFTKQQMNVRHGLDLVEWQIGTHKVRLYYQTTFELCSGIQGSIKFAMTHEGNRPNVWAEINEYTRANCGVPMNRHYRRSGHASNVKKWSTGFDGALVLVTFDELTVKMHYSDAVTMYAWLRRAGKQAKNWSGDRSRTWNTYAKLTDAEANDKIVYAG